MIIKIITPSQTELRIVLQELHRCPMDDYTFNVIYKCRLILLYGGKQVYYCIM